MVNSSFFNNSAPHSGAGITSYNSTLHVSDSDFYHNKAIIGGALALMLSVATVNNCTFFNNSNTAVVLVNNTNLSIRNSIYERKSSPVISGALLVALFSVVNVSNTKFLKNTAMGGGAVTVYESSLLVVSHCFFSENTAATGELIRKILISLLPFNVTCCSGGSIYSIKSSLLIHHTVFENNTARSKGGAIKIENTSIVIENSQFEHNKVQNIDSETGGGLSITINSTAVITGVYFYENTGGAISIADMCQIIVSNNTFEAITRICN